LLSKIIHADPQRKTRFHSLNGRLVLSPDILFALVTTTKRHLLNHYTDLPWITYPAMRLVDDKLRGRRLFEFGSGTSTKWYAERCREVYSVENNVDWFDLVHARLTSSPNAHLTLAKTNDAVIEAITQIGGCFDAIVVDSKPIRNGEDFEDSDDFRVACLRAALHFATDDCLFIIDNTDAMPLLSTEVDRVFARKRVLRLCGWVPGIFHPNETTVVL